MDGEALLLTTKQRSTRETLSPTEGAAVTVLADAYTIKLLQSRALIHKRPIRARRSGQEVHKGLSETRTSLINKTASHEGPTKAGQTTKLYKSKIFPIR